jgi:hypothetical protein
MAFIYMRGGCDRQSRRNVMKLSNVKAKLTSGLKNKAVRVLAAGALAGAIFTAAAPAAQAQRVVVGVRFGGPRYFAPPPPVRFYGGPVYAYGYPYHDDWRFRHDFHRDWRR